LVFGEFGVEIDKIEDREDYADELRAVGLMTTGARGAFDNV